MESPSQDKLPDDDQPIPVPPELIDYIPEEKREEFILGSGLQVEAYSGPIPSPKTMGDYEQIMPGAADRILTVFEKQHRHRMEMEKQGQQNTADMEKSLLSAFIRRERLGMWLGFVLALVMLTGSFAVILAGFSTVGLVTVFGSVISVAGAFLYNQHSSRKERREREAVTKPTSPPELPESGDEAGE